MKKILCKVFYIFLFFLILYLEIKVSYDRDGHIRRHSLVYYLVLSNEVKFAPVYKPKGKIKYYHYSNEYGTYITNRVDYCSKDKINIQKYDSYFQKYGYEVERKKDQLDYANYNKLTNIGDDKGDFKIGKEAWIKIENNCIEIHYAFYSE